MPHKCSGEIGLVRLALQLTACLAFFFSSLSAKLIAAIVFESFGIAYRNVIRMWNDKNKHFIHFASMVSWSDERTNNKKLYSSAKMPLKVQNDDYIKKNMLSYYDNSQLIAT